MYSFLKKISFYLFTYFITYNLQAEKLKFDGLSKLDINDIQQITSVDIQKSDLNLDEINIVITDLFKFFINDSFRIDCPISKL